MGPEHHGESRPERLGRNLRATSWLQLSIQPGLGAPWTTLSDHGESVAPICSSLMPSSGGTERGLQETKSNAFGGEQRGTGA